MTWPATLVVLLAAGYVLIARALEVAMVVTAAAELAHQRRRAVMPIDSLARAPHLLPGIAVVIPAFNEQGSIVRTVTSVLASAVANLEVVVVNDGSTDNTLGALMRAFALAPVPARSEGVLGWQRVLMALRSRSDPRLLVLDKRNGGKADALNAGIEASSRPLVCAIDADVLLMPDALGRLAEPFARDPATVAAAGTIRPLDGCRWRAAGDLESGLPRGWLERFQVLEYLRAFCLGRLAFERAGAHLLISGAFGMFRRSALIAIGGYQTQAIGEDLELVVRLHRHHRGHGTPCRITHVASALCLTEMPHTLRDLGAQRTRWHQGLLSTLRLHRDLMLDRRHGAIAWLAMPYYLLFELLAPALQLLGHAAVLLAWASGGLRSTALLGLLAWSLMLASTASLAALVVDAHGFGFHRGRDYLRLAVLGWLEPLVYRPLIAGFQLRAFGRFYHGFHLAGGWRSPRRAAAPQARGGVR